MSSAVIDAAGLQQLVSTLIDRGYRVVGPTVSDNAIVLAELTSADDLPRGWGVDVGPGHYRLRRRDDDALFGHSAGPQSWKQFLHPPRQKLWSSDGAEPEETPRYAFIGVRACDLSAIAMLNGVLGEGAFPDQGFVGRLRRIFVVAVNCTEPGGLCFCASMGTGPAVGPGYDLALTERRRSVVGMSSMWAAKTVPRCWHSCRTATLPGRDRLGAKRRQRGSAPHGPADALRRPAAAADRLAGVAALGRSRQSVPDLRKLHHGVPHLLLRQRRRRHRSHRGPRRTLDAVGVVLRIRLHLRARRQRPAIRAVAIPALDHPQARHLARPVRHHRMRGLRALYRLVSQRDRSPRR